MKGSVTQSLVLYYMIFNEFIYGLCRRYGNDLQPQQLNILNVPR